MYRQNRRGALVASVLCLIAGWAGPYAQEAEPGAVVPQPEEYTEYESVPPPDVELRSDVGEESPGEPPGIAPPAETPEAPGEAPPDLIMDEVNRELDARRGAASPSPEETADEGPPGVTAYSLLKTFAWLLVVVATILLIYYFMQRRTSGGKLLSGGRLGTVLGRIYLNPRVCLHYVRTGGKVLVVGQSQNALSLIAEFPEEEFASVREGQGGEEDEEETPGQGKDFFAQLRASLARMGGRSEEETQDSETSLEEDDIAALRGDIHRLQEYLRDTTREPER